MVRLLLLAVVCGVLAAASPLLAAERGHSTVRPFKAILDGKVVVLSPGWRGIMPQVEYAIEVRYYKNGKLVSERSGGSWGAWPSEIGLSTRFRGKMINEPGGGERWVQVVRISDCCFVVPCETREEFAAGWSKRNPRLPDEVFAAADHLSLGQLDFYVYNPDADSFEVRVRCRDASSRRLAFTPGQPLPEMVSVPPGEYREVGVLRARLYAPDLGFVVMREPFWRMIPGPLPPRPASKPAPGN